jgi:DNA-binding response OmpR family regulator
VRELSLLAALARRRGRIVSREELYAVVWDRPFRKEERSVDVYVRKLRSKLEAALPDERYIHTHFGFGYRFHHESSQHFHKDATSR